MGEAGEAQFEADTRVVTMSLLIGVSGGVNRHPPTHVPTGLERPTHMPGASHLVVPSRAGCKVSIKPTSAGRCMILSPTGAISGF